MIEIEMVTLVLIQWRVGRKILPFGGCNPLVHIVGLLGLSFSLSLALEFPSPSVIRGPSWPSSSHHRHLRHLPLLPPFPPLSLFSSLRFSLSPTFFAMSIQA